MNYIQHLTAFYGRLYNDHLFTPHHVSLYMAIFQAWNAAHFENPIQVSRGELMKLSKIGSVNTYIRCLKELHKWKLINYEPSRNISVGSRIRVITLVFCFDDLGTETSMKYYGNETNVIAEILLSRYDLFIQRNIPTHITTNLSASELESVYGNRVRSRMREMFNLIAFDSNVRDKRC